ncbi:hypothetical protein MNBD_GAMMA10-83 [hydrothermal vent metagenome]|uniref:Uncharacterized protein n=1 Tax=hydrothermal vent metagenome TaxID=652676 RepID=A0A3B0XZY9_9ZZZZ
MKNFQMGWRFTDKKYNLLPPDDLLKIEPIMENDSETIWHEYVSQNHGHLMLMKNRGNIYEKAFRVNWDDEKNGRKILNDQLNMKHSKELIFMWSPVASVKTTWGIVINYWTDFFYPDDDTVILFKGENIKLYYCEENIFTYKARDIITII